MSNKNRTGKFRIWRIRRADGDYEWILQTPLIPTANTAHFNVWRSAFDKFEDAVSAGNRRYR